MVDWVNPCELIAIGSEIGRDSDRYWERELIGLSITLAKNGAPFVTISLDANGEPVSIGYWDGDEIGDVVTPTFDE